MTSSKLAVKMAERAGMDPQVDAARNLTFDALYFASSEGPTGWQIPSTDEAVKRSVLPLLEERAAVGEMPCLRSRFAKSGLTDSAAATALASQQKAMQARYVENERLEKDRAASTRQ